jgi:hypothetical protein
MGNDKGKTHGNRDELVCHVQGEKNIFAVIITTRLMFFTYLSVGFTQGYCMLSLCDKAFVKISRAYITKRAKLKFRYATIIKTAIYRRAEGFLYALMQKQIQYDLTIQFCDRRNAK